MGNPRLTINNFCALFSAAVAVLLSTACTTSSKFKMSEAMVPPIAYNIKASTPSLDGLLHTVIVFNGPGSWKEKALLDEYFVTIRNISQIPLVLDTAELVDIEGTGLTPGNDLWELEKLSEENWKHYGEAGLSLAMGSLGTVAVAGGLGAAYITGTAAAGTAIAVLPIVAVADIVVVQVMNNNNKEKVNQEFERRRLALPITIAPGDSISGCLFFPQAPGPQKVILFYQEDELIHELEFELRGTPIADLHLE